MRIFQKRFPVLILSALLLLPVTGPLTNTALAKSTASAQTGITLDQAVNKVRRETRGRILSAKRHNGAKPVYIIKVLLKTGQIKVYRVDANTGAIK